MSQPSLARVSPSWEERKTRATKLRSQQPHAEQLLTFYLHLLELQEPVYRLALTSDWLSRVRAPSDSEYPLLRLERLPVEQMVSSFQRYLRDVSAPATDVLAKIARTLQSAGTSTQAELLESFVSRNRLELLAASLECEPVQLEFFPRAFVQPIAEALVSRVGNPLTFSGRGIPSGFVAPFSHMPDILGRRALPAGRRAPENLSPDFRLGTLAERNARMGALSPRVEETAGVTGSRDVPERACPLCGWPPQVAVIRDEPEVKGHRLLVCSLCATSWSFPRSMCPSCGETRAEQLIYYVSDSMSHVRVEECRTCQAYLKSVDLREHGIAAPLVDDLASVELDLWSDDRDLWKIQRNVLSL